MGLAIALVLLIVAPTAAGQPPDPARQAAGAGKNRPTPVQLLMQRIPVAHALQEAGDHAGADRAATALIADPLFEALPPDVRHGIFSLATRSAMDLGQDARARALALRATAIDPDDPDDWYRLSVLEGRLGEPDAAARYLARLATDWPGLLDNVGDQYIFYVVNEADHASQDRLDLLQALFDADWDRRQLGASHFWYELALMRIQRGETDAARAAIARVDTPTELVKLRSDRRFDALVDPRARQFDVERAARALVDDLRVHDLLDPANLDTLMELTYAMLAAGMEQDVLAIADKVLGIIAEAPPGSEPFLEIDKQIWIMNNRSIALRRLGRTEEALADLVRASELTEAGQVNVSQALNLGQFHCDLGQPDEALAAIAEVGEMSGYGRMVQASVQHRAALLKQDTRAADQALDYIRAHRDDSSSVLLEALVDADRLDEAAQALIELLASPTQRPDALLWLQEFRQPAPLPGEVQARLRRQALIARADVRAAVEEVGRIQRYGIHD